MGPAAWTEMQLAVGGALRLACGDRRGMGSFDTSINGFWRSFRAGMICYPLYLVLIGFRVSAADWSQYGAPSILVVETISYVISWTLFPLLILPIARWFNHENRFLAFMVVYNWAQIPQTVLAALLGLDISSGLLGGSSAQFAMLAALIATFVYEWYIARVALAVTSAQAAVVVMVDLLLSEVLNRIADALY
ncbi:MAG TPA: hypothetical protein VHW90_10350 [Stellaceae bacterium]|jgi:hypothetical protein|nr:hypothetical protein [Stellaceae bacterium]